MQRHSFSHYSRCIHFHVPKQKIAMSLAEIFVTIVMCCCYGMNQCNMEQDNDVLELRDESMEYKIQIFSESGDFWEERHCLDLSRHAETQLHVGLESSART